ncbi:hypothetical protein Ciccas_002624 [Cichlidogyrus casuarinus]|uniref:Uncharacterized protein n=1 Tax=Cichlidogyrus casuarinus TaxID=1844966 RepID=A0ABD2QGP0_9PLAT
MQYIRASPVQKHKKDSNVENQSRFNFFMVTRSPDYRNNLISAIFLPFFANVFFLTAAFVTEWETVNFKFNQLYDVSRGIFILKGTENQSIIIRDIIQVIHRNGSVTEGLLAKNPEILDRDVVGIKFEINDHNDGSNATKPWCLMNFKVGIWQNCYSNEIPNSLLNETECLEVTSVHNFWRELKSVKGVPRCSSYMNYSNPPFSANISTVNHFIKMQNNIISCAIVILLCASSALILGSYALIRLLVPGSMVCSVLYLTACQ